MRIAARQRARRGAIRPAEEGASASTAGRTARSRPGRRPRPGRSRDAALLVIVGMVAGSGGCAASSFVVGWRAERYECPPGSRPRNARIAPGLQVWCALPDGRRHGPWTAWSTRGTKVMVRVYRRGLKHGPAAGWYRSGRPHTLGWYRNGVRDGWWKFWDKRGRLWKRVRYRSGKKVEEKLLLRRAARS